MQKTWKIKESNITEPFPYRSFSAYAKETFGMKVYKVPIHLQGSCPNRDGTAGVGGCIFCGEEGEASNGFKEAYGNSFKTIKRE